MNAAHYRGPDATLRRYTNAALVAELTARGLVRQIMPSVARPDCNSIDWRVLAEHDLRVRLTQALVTEGVVVLEAMPPPPATGFTVPLRVLRARLTVLLPDPPRGAPPP